MNDDVVNGDDPRFDELTAALESIGSTEIEVGAARIDAIEARLSTLLAADDDEGGVVPIGAGRRRRRGSMWALGAVAASVLAVTVLAIGWFAVGDDDVVIAAADDVEVTLPTGEVVEGRAGLELPDGSEVAVDRGGFVEVDGVRYGPGVYEVDGDVLRPLGDTSPLGDSDDAVPIGTDPDGAGSEDAPARPAASTTTPTDAGSDDAEVPVRTTVVGDDERDDSTVRPTTTVVLDRDRDDDVARTTAPATTRPPPTTDAPPATRPPPITDAAPRTTESAAPTTTIQRRDEPTATRPPATTTTTVTTTTTTDSTTTTTIGDRTRDR